MSAGAGQGRAGGRGPGAWERKRGVRGPGGGGGGGGRRESGRWRGRRGGPAGGEAAGLAPPRRWVVGGWLAVSGWAAGTGALDPARGPAASWPEPPPRVVGTPGKWAAFVPGPGGSPRGRAAESNPLGSGCDYGHGTVRETEACEGQGIRVTESHNWVPNSAPVPPIPPQLLLGLRMGSLARTGMPAPHLQFAPPAASLVEWPKPKEPARPLSSAEVKGHQERALKTNNPPKWLFFFP